MGNAVQIALAHEFRGAEAALVVRVLLGVLGDLGHGLHRLHRVLACGGLAGEHDAGGAVIDRIGYVGNLRPGGTGVLNHGFQHFRSGDDPLAQHPAHPGQLLLNRRHLHIGNFHAQIAPGDHNAAAGGADLRHVVHAGPVLDFGNDLNVATAVIIQQSLNVQHILLCGDKGGGDEVHAVLDAEEDI